MNRSLANQALGTLLLVGATLGPVVFVALLIEALQLAWA
jgi:hypothetical protein